MGLSRKLLNNLIQLGINPESLSENEKKYLSQINDVFEEFITTNDKLRIDFMKNKFNKSLVAEKVDCSRQTLYKNPTLSTYLEWCERQADLVLSKENSQKLVTREKYDTLKKENSNLLLNIVDNAQKDSDIERLVKENKELRMRIENLARRYVEKNNEVNQLKKLMKN